MEIYGIADEIQLLCRQILATRDPAELEQHCFQLRALLREQTRVTHDQAAWLLVQVLDTEHRLKQAS